MNPSGGFYLAARKCSGLTCDALNSLDCEQCDNALALYRRFYLCANIRDGGEDGFYFTARPRGERNLGRQRRQLVDLASANWEPSSAVPHRPFYIAR